MTIIEGQVETVKRLKEALGTNGITRFNSIGEIRSFLSDFETERDQLPKQIEDDLNTEIQSLRSAVEGHKSAYDKLSTEVRDELKQQILKLNAKRERAIDISSRNALLKFFFFFVISSLSRKSSRLERNLEKIVKKKTRRVQRTIAKAQADLENLQDNRESLASKRLNRSLQELNHTKEVVDGLYTLVSGAIGEAAVVSTLRELSDEYYLINDFSTSFKPPIYNKSIGDKIYSVQIDHLLICRSGVFLLETKNWSRASLQSLDLRSPVEQVRRTSFALFVMLNSDSGAKELKLKSHHWGAKKVPIRNVIVMINEKPREEFKYVKVLSLNELIGYIRYFDESFNAAEVREIFKYLKAQTEKQAR